MAGQRQRPDASLQEEGRVRGSGSVSGLSGGIRSGSAESRTPSCLRTQPTALRSNILPEDFYLPFSDQHKIEARKLQQAVIEKAWFANADRRGGGKSTRARMFCVWGVAYGHVVYPMLITATGKSAERNRDAVVKKLMYSKDLIDDFPELCLPFCSVVARGRRPITCSGKVSRQNAARPPTSS